MDETYLKLKGHWYYLYRAVDKTGQSMDFLLTEQRDEQAAKRFLTKAIRRHGVPEKSTIDGSGANEAAIKNYNAAHGTAIAIRKIKYLNNIVEQDHRAVKWLTGPMLGFKSFAAAQCTLAGVELMHMIKKRQLVVEEGDEGLTAAELFYALAASSPHRPGQLPLHDLRSKICDTALVRAACVSTPAISARACGERKRTACVTLSKTRSSRERPWPVMQRTASRHFGASPMPARAVTSLAAS